MLKDSFYKVNRVSQDATQGVFSYEVTFIAENIIFDGHFPNQPVVPGVTIIQMVKELMSEGYKMPLVYSQVVNTKFLQVINPREEFYFSLELSVKKTDELYAVDVLLRKDELVVFKMKAKLKKPNKNA